MEKEALNKLSYGLFVLTTTDGEKKNGCVVNTVIQTTSSPLGVGVCVNKANYTCETIMKTGVFAASTISEKAKFSLIERFGFASGRNVDKFEGFDGYALSDDGVCYVTEGTNSYIVVKVEKTIDLGSHITFVGSVADAKVLSDDRSATYAYYLDNIKPRPTAKTTEKTVWRCKICGYEYEGEQLPEDYVCPLCLHPASDFEKE